MRVELYRRGYCLLHDPVLSSKSGGGKRTKLVGKTSKASFRRFRSWCIRHDMDAECWGITLTVPGLDLLEVDIFKAVHHKLCVFCNCYRLPLVWRVELQERGQPHLHCVLFGSAESVVKVCAHWYKLLHDLPPVWNIETVGKDVNDLCLISRAFVRGACHAIDMQRLSGDFRAWRYLVAHMSKRKQVQLGWRGRNWGVCNKKLFCCVEAESYEIEDHAFYMVRRWVRRLTRSKAFRGKAFLLGNPETIRKMLEYAISLQDVPF